MSKDDLFTVVVLGVPSLVFAVSLLWAGVEHSLQKSHERALQRLYAQARLEQAKACDCSNKQEQPE